MPTSYEHEYEYEYEYEYESYSPHRGTLTEAILNAPLFSKLKRNG